MSVQLQARPQRPGVLRCALATAFLAASALAVASGPARAAPDEPASTGPSAVQVRAAHDRPQAKSQPGPLADFDGAAVSDGVREVANWAFFTHDNEGRAVVILDKKAATVWAFNREGRLMASAPALLGLALGDGTVPGVGDKPLSAVPEHERTTPAGRFVAAPGVDDTGVDVVWIDYDTGVAMHRVIDTFPAQRRRERLASPNAEDRRISYGCINLPEAFYEQVLSPTVRKTGAIVYVLPETQSPREVFGSWDVTDPAARPATAARRSAPLPSMPEPQALRTSDTGAGS